MDLVDASEKINDPLSTEEASESILHTSKTHDSDVIHGAAQAEVYKPPSVYYGVALPADKMNSSNSPLIFLTKVDALKVINQFPGSRFRQFSSHEDASEFASLPVEEACAAQPSSPSSPPCPRTEEKESNYKSVSSQELVQLRKAIEMGNKNRFLECVWSNPRYLINNADGPTILQVGSRYNALHVVAKARQTELCRTILNTISDLSFLALLYPDDQMLESRRSHLLDLYLNMPDKALSESPLHFASKYGAVDILQILLSFPECERNKSNKHGFLPEHMICDRESQYTDFKMRMLKMFTDEHYVPVLRDKDNIREPVIGEPCTSHSVAEAMSGSPWNNRGLNLVSCAFAGPMLYEEAKEFYQVWKRKYCPKLNYTPDERKILKDICKSDSEKGLERIGRKLAKNLSTGWIEYWNILGTWCDISSSEGLQLLEEHIMKNYAKQIDSVSAEKEKVDDEIQITPCSVSAEEANEISSFTAEEEIEEEKYYTPPQTPVEMDITPYVLAPESPESDILLIESELSSDDIDLYRAIEKVEISSVHYPYVFKWKHMVERKLGPLFNPESKVSCTPPSSAAAVRSAIKTKSLARRVLF